MYIYTHIKRAVYNQENEEGIQEKKKNEKGLSKGRRRRKKKTLREKGNHNAVFLFIIIKALAMTHPIQSSSSVTPLRLPLYNLFSSFLSFILFYIYLYI